MRRQRSRRWRTGTAVGALGLALAGCGVFDDGQGDGTAEETDDGQDNETADASDSVDDGQPQEPPEEEDPPDYGEVVTTRDYSDDLDVEVYPVRRDGRVMTIRYGVVNETSDTGYDSNLRSYLQDAALTDLDGFERYRALEDVDGDCVCSDTNQWPARSTVIFSVTYPAAPEDVQALALELEPFDLIEEVPIRDG